VVEGEGREGERGERQRERESNPPPKKEEHLKVAQKRVALCGFPVFFRRE
jgi:hypothetical protein